MKTYYIVEEIKYGSERSYTAHRKGLLSALGIFTLHNYVEDTYAHSRADCIVKLKNKLHPKTIRIVEILRL